MRKFMPGVFLASAFLLFTSTAQATQTKRFESSITSIPAQSIRIDVGLSDDLAARAEGQLDGREHCPNVRTTFKRGFACGGFFGQRDLDHLTENMKKWTTRSFEKKDITVSDESDFVLKLTLVDVQNNRPTQRQISEQVTLSFRSIALGGADLEGELFAPDGTSLGKMSYSYYETFFDEFSQSRGVWTDAKRAIQIFSNRAAKDFAKKTS